MSTAEDRRFRTLAGGLLAAAFGVSAYFRSRAAAADGEPGSPAFTTIRFVSTLGVFGLLTARLLAPDRIRWAWIQLPAPFRWFGAGLSAVALPLFYWTFRTLDRNVTGTASVREDATLVTSGPYRYVRHPLYTVAALFWTGLMLLLGLWVLLPVGLVVGTYISRRTPVEEANLRERFGETYDEYAADTGRYLPSRG